MKKLQFAALSILACLAACAGTAARQSVLLPSMRSDWGEIKVQASREAEAVNDDTGKVAVVTAETAMAAGDPVAIAAAPWAKIDFLAASDIERRLAENRIGPNVAILLREQLAGFQQSRAVYLRSKP